MSFADFLANRQTNPGTGIFCVGMQVLKDNKDASRELWVDANAVIRYGKFLGAILLRGKYFNAGRLIRLMKFDPVADQVLKQLYQLNGIGTQRGGGEDQREAKLIKGGL